MTRLRSFAALAWLGLAALAGTLGAEPKLALIGPFGDEKALERMVGQEAIEAYNAQTPTVKIKLAVFSSDGSVEGSLQAARQAAEDPDVLGVVLHGEAAAAPEVLKVLGDAGLGSVAASSWAQTRSAEAAALWLSPSQVEMASIAAQYVRREAKAAQVAVLDNGSPTSVAAAKAFASRVRALGGKVPMEGSYAGTTESVEAAIKGLAAHWPQMVFYAGEAAAAGALIVAMKEEKALVNADLIGLAALFEPEFFNTARLKGRRTRGIFPCPDFGGQTPLLRLVGLTFPKSSPEYKAYFRAFRRPGRWTSMVFDGVALAARAVGQADQPQREAVRTALLGIESYRGIRGLVKFSPSREPQDPRSMVYFALNKVNKKEMQWREKAYGPPF